MADPSDVTEIAERYGRYPPEAYLFVGEGLRHAAKRLGRDQAEGGARHLDAGELVQGILDLAANRFGLLAGLVLREWNVRRSEDIGEITFQLIEEGIFGKQPSDSREDFDAGPGFRETVHALVGERLERSLS